MKSRTVIFRLNSSERGSFLVAAGLFMVLFLAFSTFAIDVSRYYKKKQNLQDVADGAARAGGQALNQFKNKPDTALAFEAVLDHIRNNQGNKFADLYEVHSPTNVEGIIVRHFGEGPDTNCAEFEIGDDGSVDAGEPVDVNSRVVGSSVTDEYGNRDYPVTARITVTDAAGNDTVLEPWGEYDNPNAANLNEDSSKPAVDLTDYPDEYEINAEARLYYPDGGPYSGYSVYGEKSSASSEVMTLQDGDTPPEIEGGYGQPSVADYVKNLVDDSTGKLDLQKNQAIMNFELTHDADDSQADFQDLILLLTMSPESGGDGTGGVNGPAYGGKKVGSKCSSSYDSDFYRVGVTTYGYFDPYFWPESFFGEKDTPVSSNAIAEIHPRRVQETEVTPVDCGVYSDGLMSLTGNNFDASGLDFCSNSDILAASSNAGKMGDIHLLETARFTSPGGGTGKVESFSSPRSMPGFESTGSSGYDVDLSNFDSWSDLGNCGGSPWGGGGGKSLRTSGGSADVVWSENNNPVCVEQNGTEFEVAANNSGQIQKSDGSSVTLYADRNVVFSGQGSGIYGGIYTTGNFEATANNQDFTGDAENLGGLSVWAEGDVDFEKNSISVTGITGAGGNYSFGSTGGGSGPELEGVLVAGNSFKLRSNSANASLEYDPSKFDEDYLDVGDWKTRIQESQARPLYSQVKVKLIH